MNILLLGKRAKSSELGKFAKAIVNAATKYPDITLETQYFNTPDLVIYVNRTGDQLAEAISICKDLNIPLLLLSTDVLQHIDEGLRIKIIYKPNTSIHTTKFIKDVTDFYDDNKDWSAVDITEFHQESKQDISGTAVHIAQLVKFPVEKIKSIRNNTLAKRQFNINNDDSYAAHLIKFENDNNIREFNLITQGRDSYADGAIDIARSIISNQ